ncbi:MAG TPA: heliorhodopsin HeR, partial [Dehalococcoidia bacterium]|nr:heliorhodopsin HeR [Dehalococcoidia bacterium]
FNGLMVPVHFLQGVLMLALSSDYSLPVTTAFLEYDEPAGRLVTDENKLFDVRLGPLVASFLFISALAHLAVTLPGVYQWYERNLRRGINYARWLEYSLSASVMIVIIGMLVGVYELGALILIFSVNAAMIFFGLVMEETNLGRTRVNWTPFILGCVMGIIPWVVITLYLVAPATRSIGDVPTFVYGIYVSLFLFFNVFAVNMFLQYRGIGPWRDYIFGERAYILLSLTAKSALAWQVFAGTLRDV